MTKELMQRIATYLATQPWGEVNSLLVELVNVMKQTEQEEKQCAENSKIAPKE